MKLKDLFYIISPHVLQILIVCRKDGKQIVFLSHLCIYINEDIQFVCVCVYMYKHITCAASEIEERTPENFFMETDSGLPQTFLKQIV